MMRLIKRKVCVSIAMLLLALASASTGRTIYVDDDGPADFNNIQAAINDSNDDDIIEVRPGTYTGPGNRDIDFFGKAITVRSTDPNDSNIITATVIDCNGTKAEPHRGFYFHSSEGPDSVLAGITITNGYGPYKKIYTQMRSVGGAIYLEGSSPTIRHCFVTGNSAYAYGGAFYCVSSNPLIKECVISRNFSESDSGGAIYFEDSSPSIIDCNITGNSADGSGGGINSHKSSPKIFNCSITGNSANNGGGFACYQGSPMISHCKIMNNSATYSAGGIRCSYFSSMFIDNCVITGNIAHSGGGIYVWQASADIIHCTVANNLAEHGGGIYCGAIQSIVTMSHCILWNNKSNSGAQVMLSYNSSEQSHFTISHSNIQGGKANLSVEPGWILNWGKSNIDSDPLFVDESDYNYHLSAHSLCIDAGDPAYVVLPEETDIDGGQRVLGIRTDIGADESIYVTETPVIGFSPAKFVLYSYAGGPSPKDQTLFIRNTGISTLTWQTGEDCSWIELFPANGQSVDEVDEVTVKIDTTGFSVGSYLCELKIIGEGAFNNPQVIPINVHVANRELHVPSEYPTIQAAIDAAVADGQAVIVADNIYIGEGNRDIDFKGKSITVRSKNGPENCIIDCQKLGGGFFFRSGEDANSIIDGFTITNSQWSGISCRESSPTISNCNISNCSGYQGGGIECRENSCPTINNCIITRCIAGWGGGIGFYKSNAVVNNCLIVGNEGGDAIGGIYCVDSVLTVTNCTISDNMSMSNYYGVILCRRSSLTITNCILWGNSPGQISDPYNDSVISVNYSDIESGWQGVANIDVDPCFVRPGYWGDVNDPNIIFESNDPNAIWVNGDYHLKSQAGRWDVDEGRWTKDEETSSCIDAGDLDSDWTAELWPHGMRINMGAYGGTPEASMSLLDTGNIADLNTDEIVDFRDFADFINSWHSQRVLSPEDLDRNGMVDFNDLVIFAEHWLTTAEIILLPGRASNPYPANGATNVNINVVLSWTPGARATSHDVYFGRQSPGIFQRNQPENTFAPGILRSQTKYYWRIDEANSDGKTTGTVWSFTTGGKVVCFPAETLVWVDGALVKISTVSPKQSVGSLYNITPIPFSKEIEKVEEHEGTFKCYDITFENGNCISVADNHYFLLDTDLWVSVQELTRGSRLQSFNGPIAIESVVKRVTPLVGKVYNLKIKDSDRYFVGKDGVIVRDY